MILYTISFIATVLCFLSLVWGVRLLGISFTWKEIVAALREAPRKPFSKTSILLFIFLGLFMLLPFFWILSIYLKTDANVLSVIISMFWSYHIIKYLYPEKKELKENSKPNA